MGNVLCSEVCLVQPPPFLAKQNETLQILCERDVDLDCRSGAPAPDSPAATAFPPHDVPPEFRVSSDPYHFEIERGENDEAYENFMGDDDDVAEVGDDSPTGDGGEHMDVGLIAAIGYSHRIHKVRQTC